MIAISCDNITLSFGVDKILENVSFSLNEGDKMGIVGVNGAGKSTLFHIINGEYTPDSGSVYISKDKEVGTLNQQPIFSHDNTLLEEMLNTFPALLAQEKELAALEEQLNAGDHSAAGRYSALQDQFTRAGATNSAAAAGGCSSAWALGRNSTAWPFLPSAAGRKPGWLWPGCCSVSPISSCWTSPPTIWTWIPWFFWRIFCGITRKPCW